MHHHCLAIVFKFSLKSKAEQGETGPDPSLMSHLAFLFILSLSPAQEGGNRIKYKRERPLTVIKQVTRRSGGHL